MKRLSDFIYNIKPGEFIIAFGITLMILGVLRMVLWKRPFSVPNLKRLTLNLDCFL